MIKEYKSLGLSFELPDRPTVHDIDEHQRLLGEYITAYKGPFLSTERYRAMTYSVAVETGLITNWQCETMPDMRPADLEHADGQIINIVGYEVDQYFNSFTTIPPN